MEDNRLLTEKISKLLLSLAFPAICAHLITLFYNLVDRIFIGRMEDGVLAMGAIGICAPVATIINAFAELSGAGGAPLAAIHIGRGDNAKAEKYLGNSFSVLTVISLVITSLVLLFRTPLLTLFGASRQMLSYAGSYMTIYCLGTFFVQMTVGMNYYITTQGFAKTAMITTMLGGILNIILDPIFIFGLGMGIRGAALATVLSQLTSFIWVMRFLLSQKPKLRLRLENMKIEAAVLKEIAVLGSAPFFMSVSEGILNVCFNHQVLRFGGDLAVSAMTILFSIFQFILLPVEGVAQGAQPIIGQNYGAGNSGRVKETIKLAAVGNLIFTVCATSLIMAFPAFFIRIFNPNIELVRMGERMLRIYAGGFFVVGLNSTFQQTYNALGEGKRAFFFAFYRKGILLIPLLYLLPCILPWGVLAVMLAEPVSDILTTGTNALYFRRFINKKL